MLYCELFIPSEHTLALARTHTLALGIHTECGTERFERVYGFMLITLTKKHHALLVHAVQRQHQYWFDIFLQS